MPSGWATLCAVALACVIGIDIILRRLRKVQTSTPYPLPPGPPPSPIIGNVHGIDPKAPWLTYTEWSKVYGDVVYSRLFNHDVITINSEKAAKALLEDRSSNYADRPHLVTNKLFGVDFNTILMPYGDRWRLQRRFFHQTFKADSALRFAPMQQRKARLLAHRLLTSPDHFFDHFHEFTSSVIINAIYDYDPEPQSDYIADIVKQAAEFIGKMNTPEVAGIINAFPMILKVPSWFPGMGMKRDAALSRALTKGWVEIPFKHALQKQNEGSPSPALVLDGLREDNEADEWIQALKEAAATGFVAASESSCAFLMTFLYAMVLHPDVQDKAFVQIEAVVGKGNLPTIEDRESLPYIDAIIRETFRWYPTLPLSIPHAVVNDDIYEGCYIPKGAIVLPNIWSMTHDETKYAKPYEFFPERFLHCNGTLTADDVRGIAFGFGRRICAGRHFAEISLWYAVTSILTVWRVSWPKNEQGQDITHEPRWASGITMHPLPFPCRFEPRVDEKTIEDLVCADD